MFNAKYIQRGDIIDYTPSANTGAGEIVFIGSICGITKLPIKANELGALAITGVYEFAKATGTALAVGTGVYWDASNSRVITTPNAKYIGICVAAAASADTDVRVLINKGTSAYDGQDSSSSN